ncbi:branched-chain amino acid ABC transporter permease [Nostocoides sp. HKS02]|uniref:branched-chain amino acid ABC transporter permease n=1 Tax=Nostocoides sp. HKS02 TaxID=1813880 RepID=UPI0012B4F0C0|nr:branched-chain amino acid ABC transporter permease [Tetrasphaera sp. HKS02]QGN57177.1 branched-chain amino acid ABC transporter permease [Tetrasphaera sp. HKS02]
MNAVSTFFHGIGDRYRALPRWAKLVLMAALVVLVYLLPIINPPLITTTDSDFGAVLFLCALYALVAIGLNIVIGYAGLLDLGYIGFFAIGAFTVGVLGSAHGKLPLLLLIPIAMAMTLVSGIILGAPTLRVRGDYLAIVTLGFGEIVRLILVNADSLTGGSRGISNIPTPPGFSLFSIPHVTWQGLTAYVDTSTTTTFLQFGVTDSIPYYWLALTLVFIVLFLDWRMQNSRVGRAWEATREDEDAAELMGVPTFRFKLLAFATGAAIGGLSGALFATKQQFINPDNFTILYSVLFVAMVVVGGQGNRWGVVVAAALLTWAPEKFRFLADARFLLFGLALMALAIFRPQGLMPPRRSLRAKRADEETEVLEEGVTHA